MRLRTHLRTLASPSQSGKAWTAAVVGFCAPIGALLAGQDEITWRTFAAAVVAGIISGVSVYATRNVKRRVRRRRSTGQHAAAVEGAPDA